MALEQDQERKWSFYETKTGGKPVDKELSKAGLTVQEKAKLYVLMGRVKNQATLPGDVKNIGDDILEIRLQGNHRIFRLLYAEEEDGLVLLALCFFQKKQQKTPPDHKAHAVDRHKDWKARRKKSASNE